MNSVSVAPDATQTLLTVPGKFTATFSGCTEDAPWFPGSFGTHLIFTALGPDEIVVNGVPVTADGTPTFSPLMIDHSGGPYTLEDWTTRETWQLHLRAESHSGSVDGGDLRCNVNGFVVTTSP